MATIFCQVRDYHNRKKNGAIKCELFYCIFAISILPSVWKPNDWETKVLIVFNNNCGSCVNAAEQH